ncbi:MAG: TIR domain-containing protein [Verrucomicrobiota bacterium]|nr:TIR domain-containing protein [Verrucomicrobiota bacterium]
MSTEVFISYAAKDRTRVLDLVERLRTAGVSVWIDQMGIEGATMWSQEIVAAIRSCKVLILAISENSAGSENVVKEVALASEGRKRILPVYIEQAEIPESMAYQLAGIQRIEFFEGREDAAQQAVIRALAKLGVTVADDANAAAANTPGSASHGPSHPTGKTEAKGEAAVWLKVAGVVVGLAVLGMAGTFFFGSSTTTTPMPIAVGQAQTNTTAQATLDTNRVVVLPFKVIGTSNETADMGYGLVSTLTSKLQPLQNLVVIAKESARKFKDSEQSPREIGQALGAGTIVTGEIQTGGGNIQVNIQLINANTEALGWGSTFTKSQDEFLDLQNEIATQLASELKGGLDAAETQQLAQKATDNAEAQAEYEAGRREWNRRNKEGFDNAIRHFERAIELDSDYAEPYVGLSNTYALLSIYNFASPGDSMPRSRELAEKAMSINPSMGSVYTAIAWVQFMYDYEWENAGFNFKKGVELNPNNATGFHWYAIYLLQTGKVERVHPTIKKAKELDPQSMIIKNDFAHLCWHTGIETYESEVMQSVEEALEMDPHFEPALRLKYCFSDNEHPSEGIKLLQRAREIYPNQPSLLISSIQINLKAGEKQQALEIFVELLDKHKDTINRSLIAQIYFHMGKMDDGFRWLEKSGEIKEPSLILFANSRHYQFLKKEPRFREIFKKINHPLYVD